MTISRILFWLVGGVLAVLVGMSSAVIANQVKHPSRSMAIGVAPMGRATANLAFASYAARQQRDPKAMISKRERALATQAYRSEPLSSAALGMLIASTDRANGTRRQALLDLGGKLTRRSSLITSASIEAAALRGDETDFFRWLSRAILTSASLRTTYIQAMAQATARPGSAATLAPVIGSNPSWSDRYWNAVTSVSASLENAAELRVLIAGAPWRQTGISDTDRLLAMRLVEHGHFDTARRMAAALSGVSASPTAAGLIINSDFSRSPALPPNDWQLASSGNLGATIDAERNLLSLSAIAGARGYAARQLVELAPGEYEIEWDLVPNAAIEKGTLTARIACAEKGSNSDIAKVIDLDAGHERAEVAIVSSDCRWHWLSVNVSVPDMSPGIDAQFRRVNLRRIN